MSNGKFRDIYNFITNRNHTFMKNNVQTIQYFLNIVRIPTARLYLINTL